MMLLYSFALTIALVLSAPWWMVRMVTTSRYRDGLWERLGAVPGALRGLNSRVVWVHAVSVGEVLAASRLVAELGEKLGEGWVVVVSTTTRTGQELARERFGVERVFYCPLDFGWAVRAYLRVLRPAALVLMESEIWPRMLHECKKRGTPVAVVNARVSDRSFGRAAKVRGVWGRVLSQVTLWLAQSEDDARRLVAMGARSEAVRVGGNLKFDVRAPKECWAADVIRKAAVGRPIVVAGSTLGSTGTKLNEERMVLRAWHGISELGIKALLVIAPRHPERFESVERQVDGYCTIRVTSLMLGCRPVASWASDPFGEDRPDAGVVILDTVGDLAAVYGVADIAFVGGSLVDKGGHNPLEPAQFGVPVVMGPSFENFRDIVTKMKNEEGILIVQDEDELGEALIKLLMDPKWAMGFGERGKQVFEAQQGATLRAVNAILGLVDEVKA
jgi:3-deoxy-D-manno-octulosonic-acid transferase